jgi:hypothetical protein
MKRSDFSPQYHPFDVKRAFDRFAFASSSSWELAAEYPDTERRGPWFGSAGVTLHPVKCVPVGVFE